MPHAFTLHVRHRPDDVTDVLIGPGLLRDAGRLVAERALGDAAVVVSQPAPWGNLGKPLLAALKAGGVGEAHAFLFGPGERQKTLRTYTRLLVEMAAFDQALERDLFVVGFGGGVACDVAGFAAATYRRGVPLVNVPTTLLAAVDAAVGGKNGVNVGTLKNAVGTIVQPRLVAIDTETFASLPPREIASGLAEIIKHAVIADAELFAFVEARREALLAADPAALAEAVARSLRVKARFVKEDPLDRQGRRALLNFGHTVGHALEAATGFRRLPHGEAVAVGMCVAADAAVDLGLFAAGERDRLVALLAACGLPVSPPRGLDLGTALAAMARDKKFRRGAARYVLPRAVGHAVLHTAPDLKALERALARRAQPSAGSRPA
ncbi:MAG: 3-dehydroquinate synthase [Planctomycetes bacterium]|nr:3-dehydroquinate synthase [Planctomycetota bacterium]